MKLVMFDIDGTLTRTDEADEVCFVAALREVFGFERINTDWKVYPHCSDSAILEALFQERLGRLPTAQEIAAVQRRLTQLLEEEARARPFEAIHGASEMLHILLSDRECAVSIASGAWECSARIKLATAGLGRLEIPAAFADDGHARETIMEVSLARALQACSRNSFDQVIYIGDGVWDGKAARNLRFPFVGIATDNAKAVLLRAQGAWAVFHDYSDPAAFLSTLEKAAITGERM